MEADTATPVLVDDEESGDEAFAELQLRTSDLLTGVVDYASSDSASPRHILDDSASSPTRSPNAINGVLKSPTLMYASKGPISMDIDDSQDLFADVATLPFADVTLPSPLNGHATNGFGHQHDTLASENGASPDVPGDDESSASLDASLHVTQTPTTPLNGKKNHITVEIPQTPLEDATPFTPATPAVDDMPEEIDDDIEEDSSIPYYLRPYAVAPVEWDPQAKVKPPQLLRGTLRPYQP